MRERETGRERGKGRERGRERTGTVYSQTTHYKNSYISRRSRLHIVKMTQSITDQQERMKHSIKKKNSPGLLGHIDLSPRCRPCDEYLSSRSTHIILDTLASSRIGQLIDEGHVRVVV